MKIVYAVISIFILFVIGIFLSDKNRATYFVGSIGGMAEAKYDLMLNRYNLTNCDLVGCYNFISFCGNEPCPDSYIDLNDPVLIERDKIFLTKYGIRYRRICGPSTAQSSETMKWLKEGYSHGYDGSSYAKIKERFGEDIYEKVEKEALQEVLRRDALTQYQRAELERRLANLK